jgi:hypothetical protein
MKERLQHETWDSFRHSSTLFRTILAIFDKSSSFFVFFRFSLKISVFMYHTRLPYFKPNPKGIFVQCPYSDKSRFFSLKPSTPKNKPFQTICLAPFTCEAGRRAVNLAAEKAQESKHPTRR